MKIACEYCGFENIEGNDGCEKCGQSLSDMHLKSPQTEVEKGLFKDRISCLAPRKPFTVSEDATVGEVLNLMVQNAIGCVFVVNANQKLTGVFSERDALMRLNIDAAQLSDKPIRNYMTPNPQGLKADSKIAFAVHQMDVGHFRHIPILDDSNLTIGVISVRDILRYLTSIAS
jgi:CBS domain-containing protein